MKVLEVEGARRLYHGKAAVDGASLALERGRITCLLGPSGCGKSTLLRLIAGLEPLDEGLIKAGDVTLSAPGVHAPPEKRDIGLVFQDYALFPHLTVEQNVGFGLRRMGADERRARVEAELTRVKLGGRAASYPQALSGGEQQRVALARALARKPAVILLDEPFSGLDARLKAEVRDTTLAALREAKAAALIVTHDAEEAMMMADDLVLMEAGRILQAGSPQDCYLKPASIAAARLLGEVSVLPARLGEGVALTAFGPVPAEGAGEALVAVRPEGVVLSARGGPAKVAGVSFAGGAVMVTLQADGASAQSRVALAEAPDAGEAVRVSLDPRFCAVFGKN